MNRRTWTVRAAVLGLVGAVALMVPAAATAAEDAELIEVSGPVPQEILDKFEACPGPETLGDAQPGLCINISISGDLKLGHVESSIDEPLETTLALGLEQGTLAPVIVEAEGDPPAPVPVSGGILGIEALDPILELEPLGLLTLSASPTLGEIDTGGDDLMAGLMLLALFAGQMAMLEEAMADLGPVELGVPLSLKLNNTLFGNKCQIGTPESPIDMRLTVGESDPGEESGWGPIHGELGEGTEYLRFIDVNNYEFATTEGTLLVDNRFVTPGPQQCDLLLGDALDSPTGLFDGLIRAQTGLPAGPGGSQAQLVLDTEVITHLAVHPQ